MQRFRATCVRNLLIVKNLEHRKFQELYHVKEERLFYLFLTFEKLCHVHFDHTEPCCKLLRQTSKIKKLQTSFRMVLFQGIPLNNYGVECKENSTIQKMSKFPIKYLSLCVNFAFILNTLHGDAYRRDGVVKFQNSTPKVAYFCNLLSSLASETGLLLNN